MMNRSKRAHLGMHDRIAEMQREKGSESRYKRCPRCKKLRLKRMLANDWRGQRTNWQRIDGKTVCFVCVQRIESMQIASNGIAQGPVGP